MTIDESTQQILDFISKSTQGYGCTQIADELGLGIPTARRLLQVLATMGRVKLTRNSKGKTLYIFVSEQPISMAAPSTLPPFKPLEGYAAEMRRIAASAVAGR